VLDIHAETDMTFKKNDGTTPYTVQVLEKYPIDGFVSITVYNGTSIPLIKY